ncbi:MAG: hypothetical protein HY081_00465 [Gammaproteobacteria bacterium]|nr:hypothetical protein [Gammaproteobacteria bacterium]
MRLLVRVLLILLFASLAPVSTAADSIDKETDTSSEINTKKYFAITLRSSFTPISDKQAKRDFPDSPVYLLQTKAFGKSAYHVRLGFFENFADAMAYRDNVLTKYPAAWVTEISSNEYTTILRNFPDFKMAASKPSAEKTEPKSESPATAPVVPAPVPTPPITATPSVPTTPLPKTAPPAPPAAGAFLAKALYAIQSRRMNRKAPCRQRSTRREQLRRR